MDWSLISLIVFFALVVGHILFDLRTLVRNLHRTKEHINDGSVRCDTCHARVHGIRELRHETIWIVAGTAVLVGHIVSDFMRW